MPTTTPTRKEFGCQRLVRLACGAFFAVLLAHGTQAAQLTQGGAAPASGPRFRLIRSVSGSKGVEEGGRFLVEDPRTVFYIPADRQIVFYLEWEGVPGPHRLEGLWTDPAGKVASVAAFDYEARERRFGARWSLPLSETFPVGLWTFEARIDGESAGKHPFQVTSDARAVGAATSARRPLRPGDAYRRLVAATAVVEKVNAAGEVVFSAMGFVAGPNRVVTAFQAVDGATSVRLRFADGRTTEIRDLAAWNRWQDWAAVAVDGAKDALPRAAARAWQVGDRVYTLAMSADAALTIVEAAITGTATHDRAGERISFSATDGRASIGAPLLDEYGDVLGVVGGQTVPGASSLIRPMPNPSATDDLFAKAGGDAVPVEWVQAGESSSGTPFSQLLRQAEFVPLLGAGRQHVGRATTAQRAIKERDWIDPSDERAVFSRKSGPFAVVLNMRPRAKVRLSATCRLFDLDGRLRSDAKAMQVKANVTETPSISWSIDPTTLVPGIYRLDITFDGEPVWRTFVRITG